MYLDPEPPALMSLQSNAGVSDDLARLVDVFPEGIIFIDRQWRITYANQAARQISRIGEEDLNGPTHWELYPATLGTMQERIYRDTMENRVPRDHEFYYPPYQIWISLRTYPLSSGIAVHYRDVTRLKQTETLKDESARQLQQVMDATTDGVVLFDRDYRFTFLNRRARELLGPSGDVLGKNLWLSFPGQLYVGSPFISTYVRAMEERVGGSFEAFYPEPLNAWLSVEAQPADDGVIVFFRDITEERRAAEELLRKTEETSRQAAEIETVYRTAPIGLALFDTEDFRYLRLNDRQAAFFGLKPEQVVGRTLTEMAPIPGLHELFEQVREGTPVVNYPLEGALISDPNEHRYWTVNYSPVRAPDGTVQAISAASLEITAQRKAEKALLQSQKLAAVGRLASSISHEINNPLESVTNLLYLIAQQDGLTAEGRSYVELAQSELARVSQIATQTLRFHRQTAEPSLVTAEQLIQPVLNLYQGRFTNCNITVDVRYAGSSQIRCLENEIRQVLNNLIANAIDAMRGERGRLIVRAHSAVDPKFRNKGIRIVIADNGHGMSPAVRERIFEPFFTTKELNGTGLGLWISSEIVRRHQGRLTVRSAQGARTHGTVFALFLPAVM